MNSKSTAQETSTPQIEEIITEDGILFSIISLLPLREAARTSVLSRRWRHIWTYRSDFMFDAATMLDDPTLRSKIHLIKKEKRELLTDKFIQSINSVLQQHQGHIIHEIQVKFSLHKAHAQHLDAWVRFALASKTKKFGLFLDQQYSDLQIEQYDFPCQLLESSSSIQGLALAYCRLKPSNELGGFSHLTQLLLYHVDITEEDINRLVSGCSTLKKLSLWDSRQLVTLSIPCPLSQLWFLLVKYCDQLRKIEIDAANLLKIDYDGPPIDFIFKQSSKLREAVICFESDGKTHNLDFYLTQLSKNLPHLKSLTFHITGFPKVVDLPKGFNSFVHLKHLNWRWNLGTKMSFLRLATLLDAAPFLRELKLRLSTRVVEQPPETLSKLKEMLPKQPHNYLRTIEVSDFYCDKWQVEIALYLLNNAIKLVSMTIEKGRTANEVHESGIKNLSREVPAKVKLVIV